MLCVHLFFFTDLKKASFTKSEPETVSRSTASSIASYQFFWQKCSTVSVSIEYISFDVILFYFRTLFNLYRSEFIGASENKETIWVASYEESTENHQLSTNQAIASSTMHSTKNDTISMQIDMDIDCSNISFNQPQPPSKQSLIPRPSNGNSDQTIKTIAASQQSTAIDQIANDDADSKNPKLSMFQQLLKLQEQQQLQQQEQQQKQQQKKQETIQTPVPRVFRTNKIDMEMSTVASEQQTTRRTIVQTRDISMNNSLDIPNSGHFQNNGAVTRPTTRNTVFDAKNMSLDHNQSNTGSFDLNKTNQHTTDMSIMMERQPIRGTVIFKSPKKGTAKSLEKTIVFDADIEVTDVTTAMRNISYNPIQIESHKRNLSTIMSSIAEEQPMEKRLNETVNDEMEMDESFVQKTDTMPLVKSQTIFKQNRRTTTYESMPVEMSITQSFPVKKSSTHLLPLLSHADKENDPRIIDMLMNIDAVAADANGDLSLDNTLKSESAIIENVFETKSMRPTIFDQNSLEMSSDALLDPKPGKRVNLNKTPFVGGNAFGRKGSLDLNESIDINDTLNIEATQPLPNTVVRMDKKRQTIHYNESLELSNVSFDMRGAMVAESTGKIPQVVDQSKNISLDLNDAPLEINCLMPPPVTDNLLNRIKRATTFANQSIEMGDNSMEQTHPNPAKKFNPNKTPFYFNEEKQSDLEISVASNSSIMNLDNTLQKQRIQLVPKSDNNLHIKQQRRTELFHETISGGSDNGDHISIHADASVNDAVVISDSSNMNISIDPLPSQGQNRATCYQRVSMVQDEDGSECRYANQTKVHLKTIIIDDDDDECFVDDPKPKRMNRETSYKNELMLLEDKSIIDQTNVKMDSCCYLTDIGETDTPSEKWKSSIIVVDTSLEPSKLSFYEEEGDDDDDEFLCNTKLQLIESYENVSNEDVARNFSMASKRSFDHKPEQIIDSYRCEIPVADELSETKQSISELPAKCLDMNEDEIFKKSTLLRRSGVHEEPPSIDGDDDNDNEQHPERLNRTEMNNASVIVENQREIFKRPKSLAKTAPKTDGNGTRVDAVDDQQQPSTSKQADHVPSTSNRSHIQRPSIIRRSINCDGPLDETSFLMNMTDGDKPASELKIDLSGYKKFEGLATIGDVLRNHQLRRNEMARQIERWNYQLEHKLPMEDIDDEEDSSEDVESQNIEAPSWAFLWRNKIKWEM